MIERSCIALHIQMKNLEVYMNTNLDVFTVIEGQKGVFYCDSCRCKTSCTCLNGDYEKVKYQWNIDEKWHEETFVEKVNKLIDRKRYVINYYDRETIMVKKSIFEREGCFDEAREFFSSNKLFIAPYFGFSSVTSANEVALSMRGFTATIYKIPIDKVTLHKRKNDEIEEEVKDEKVKND